MNKGTKPDWIKKAIRNEQARKRYFIKRYGSLDRMNELDAKRQDQVDWDSAMEEWHHGTEADNV